jgi:brefeldin A-resistance guanine nucleotide exchange factor 1
LVSSKSQGQGNISNSYAILQEFTSPSELRRAKSQKKLVLTGASRFNSKPKLGLAYLEENKLIYSDLSPEVSRERSLAIFLKNCSRLDKRLLGDFISKPENIEILRAFIGLFDFKGVSTNNVHWQCF